MYLAAALKISIGTVGNFERLVVRLDSDCMMLPEELASLLNVDTCDVLVADLDGLIRWVIPDDAERPRGVIAVIARYPFSSGSCWPVVYSGVWRFDASRKITPSPFSRYVWSDRWCR